MSGPFGCSHHSTPCRARELAQQREVGVDQRLEVAQDERGDAVADRELDLRQAVARRHRRDQRAQRHDQVADVARHDVAAPDLGDEARLALVEADQDRALLDDVAHREARPLPVVPVGPAHRPQDALGRGPCRDARARPRARAAWSRPARRRRGAASCSRRRRRSAGSAARPAASSRGAARPASPAPSCSCAAWSRREPLRPAARPRRRRPCLRRCGRRLAPRDRATRSAAIPRRSSSADYPGRSRC